MITPLCYFTHNPKEGSSSNYNDPVTDKITDAIHDKRMNLLFNKHNLSLDDVLSRIYSEPLLKSLDRSLAGIEVFRIGFNPYIGHPIFNVVRRAFVKELTSKFKITFRE